MTVQDWHAHAEQVATPARTISAPRPTEHTSPPASGLQNDLAADLAALTRVLLGVGNHVTPTPRVTAAAVPPPVSPTPEPEPAPLFVAPALVEVPSLVEVAAPVASPVASPRVSATRLIDDLGFLDV